MVAFEQLLAHEPWVRPDPVLGNTGVGAEGSATRPRRDLLLAPPAQWPAVRPLGELLGRHPAGALAIDTIRVHRLKLLPYGQLAKWLLNRSPW